MKTRAIILILFLCVVTHFARKSFTLDPLPRTVATVQDHKG